MRLIDPYRFGGVDPILIIGDSIAAGLAAHAASTLPASGSAYEYDRTTTAILNFGDGVGVTGFSFNSKSPWAKFCIDYIATTGHAPCIINRAASSSTISPAISGLVGNDWQTSGTNYNAAVTAANDCLSKLGKTKLSAILVILGINDVQGQSGTGAQTIAQVGTHLGTLVSNLIADFGSDVPIVFAQIGQTSTIKIDSRLSGIRNQIKQRCVSTSNCYMGSNLGGFAVGGFYESDDIHPNVSGNDHLGAMFARWFKNSAYSKWPRAIISCHFDEISSAYKSRISTWFSTYGTIYQSIDCMYVCKSSLSINTAWDWAFICAPDLNGGYSWVSDSHIATAGNTSSLFALGYDPSKTNMYAANNDYGFELKLKAVGTASGVTAAVIGGFVSGSPNKVSFLRQLNTLGINWSVLSQTSYTYAGENNLSAGSWMAHRDTGGTISLRKNGTVVAGPTTDTLAAPPGTVQALGCFYNSSTASSPIDAQFERVVFFKSSVVSDKSAFVTDLNTMMSV